MILGFLWIDVFSEYSYPQLLAGFSAGLSLVLLPMLFVRAPFRQLVALSNARFEHLLTLIQAISIGTIAVASTYNFRLVAIANIYDYRGEIAFPGPVRYLIGWVSSTLLPFAFACYWLLGHRWRAVLVVILLLFLYPITLTKFTFFTPTWLFAPAVLSRFCGGTNFGHLVDPLLVGLVANVATGASLNGIVGRYFDLVNIRMIATASSALDIYNDFFTSHPLTHFCQISLLKTVMPCAYQDQLSVVMQDTYGFGMINASLFATEAVASGGVYFAPLTAPAAGFILALGNRASTELPQCFVLISSGTLPHVLLNTPLSVTMVTHGAALLFLLWYVTPRHIFKRTGRNRNP